MSGRLEGKTALVTGAGQGIGTAIAEALAAEGARVAVSDLDADAAKATAARIASATSPDAAFAIALDATSEADWKAAIDEVRAQLGSLSILVNNAGILTVGSVEELSLDEWRKTMAINADSVFLGCKYALPLMQKSQPASIINMSSVSALIASGTLPAYNASKAAVLMLTKSVALHCAHARWDIRCNSIHPTFVKTPLLDGFARNSGGPEVIEKLTRQVPLKRIGEVEDVAAAVVYLASDESRMMTGSELKLDGGMTAM